MDQESLRVFVTLAEQLHFRKTSELHHMTTSALSRMIQRLEADLGATLFTRSKRRVSLTEGGEKLLSYAKEMLEAYEQLRSDLHVKDPKQLRGSIKIYATVTAAYSILPRLVKRFSRQYPGVTLYLETGAAKNAYTRLGAGEVDFAIGIMRPTQSRDLLCHKVLETPLVFVSVKNSGVKNPADCSLIFPEQGDLATVISSYLEKQKRSVSVHSYVDGHEAILAMVAAGLGAAILPKIVIDNSHLKDTVSVIQLRPPLPMLSVGLFVRRDSLKSPVKRLFWEGVK